MIPAVIESDKSLLCLAVFMHCLRLRANFRIEWELE
jgi:hypothetical protein